MDKKIIPALVLLFALMLLWPIADRKWVKPLFPAKVATPIETLAEDTPSTIATDSATGAEAAPAAQPATPAALASQASSTALATKEAAITEIKRSQPEQLVEIKSPTMALTFSSYGAGIQQAILSDYPELNQPNSPPVELHFTNTPALLYLGLSGIAPTAEYTLLAQTPTSLLFQTESPDGLLVTRSVSLIDDYELSIVDTFANQSDSTLTNTGISIQLGDMNKTSERTMKGVVDLGVDIFTPGVTIPYHYGTKIDKFFAEQKGADGRLPVTISKDFPGLLDWVAVKNKYFVQILSPENGGDGCTLFARRGLATQEEANPYAIVKMQPVAMVSATMQVTDLVLKDGETVTRTYHCYIGPKKYDILKTLGFQQEGVMEFASANVVFRSFNFVMVPVKAALLWLLNVIHDHVWPHNYGIAIILITILIRIIFWPVTHKSTESMKKMAELQPLIKQLKEKYKNDSQKLQQATMALYKENKVNPMGGCLPMVIQIPVFIALFVVLRNAIELRFAHFLWVADLSEPENLLAGVLPIPLNILPLIMVVTQFIQQKMMPTSADPQQAKIMQYMPLMFLFFFYTMPSGLVLYWTTNQCLMIVQQLFTKKKQARTA